jgi:hypothetical protein
LYALFPDAYREEREACRAAKDRVERTMRDRSALHHHEAAKRQAGGPNTSLGAVLDGLAEELAAMAPTAPSIIKLAEAEVATGPLEATPGVVAVLDSCGTDQGSVESFLRRLVAAIEGTETMETPGETEPSISDEGAGA